jgi:aspartyl-tRNA(Asn)/glutamyl-tRNA(Gln) amidotransferase subunit A
MPQPKYTKLTDLQTDLKTGATSVEAIVQHYLMQIDASTSLNIYIEVYAEEALAQARALDAKLQAGTEAPGKLFGLVLSHKDVICYKDHGVTAGSKMLEGFTSLFSATAIERLLAEDAIIIGRVNCDEFAMGSTNETSVYGPTRNGADPSKVPGGSSGASAVAVQMDTCLVSLGSDTGGSVRQPAGFCGVLGMKPSYGRISRHGLLAYGSSFDQIGILAHSVADIAATLEIMAGPDDFDSTVSQAAVPNYVQHLAKAEKAKIAYFDTAINHPQLDPEVRTQSQALIQRLQAAGHTVEAVPFDYLDYIIPAYYVLTTAEASSNLSRYDGIRFGHRASGAKTLIDTYKQSRTEGFGTEVKRRIMLGTFVLSSGYYDAYYSKAQKVRQLVYQATKAIFQDYDYILMPTAPSTAGDLGESLDDPVKMYLADIFTVQANMTGIPAIALPLGTHSNGLPIGIQFMADNLEEANLLAFAEQVEKM